MRIVISVVKEIIKYFSQEMCTNYELYYEIDELSKNDNALLQFAKYMINHNHIYVTPGKKCADNDKVIAHASQPFFGSGICR